MNKIELVQLLEQFPDDMEMSIFDYGKVEDDAITEYEILDVIPWVSEDGDEQKIAICMDSGYDFEDENEDELLDDNEL